ncbi:MAG: hypothetical protein KDD51_11540, partial [Bdellovibrionales bacterium]|nr:hypothetical protein [Bdellovibrionales bacterium]
GVLIFSRTGVLRSLGWLAFLGTLSIWWVGLFLLPAVLERVYGRKSNTRPKLRVLDTATASVPEEKVKTLSP